MEYETKKKLFIFYFFIRKFFVMLELMGKKGLWVIFKSPMKGRFCRMLSDIIIGIEN